MLKIINIWLLQLFLFKSFHILLKTVTFVFLSRDVSVKLLTPVLPVLFLLLHLWHDAQGPCLLLFINSQIGAFFKNVIV